MTAGADLAWPPDDPAELAGFPRRRLRVGQRLWRIHRGNRRPFFFASAPPPGHRRGGRYDLPAPQGTSSWALHPEAAFLETLARRPTRLVAAEHLDRYRIAEAPLPGVLEAANLPVRAARRFGLTAEIHTTTDYQVTRTWAERLNQSAHRAVIGIARHDVTARLRILALFDTAGEHAAYGWTWSIRSSPIGDELIARMGTWGIRVVPVPEDLPTIIPSTSSH